MKDSMEEITDSGELEKAIKIFKKIFGHAIVSLDDDGFHFKSFVWSNDKKFMKYVKKWEKI